MLSDNTDISTLKDLVVVLLSKVELLEASNRHLFAENAALRAENAALRAENASLREQLNKNSTNSHKPPSSDGYGKQPALPRPTGKKSGGQSGHPGHTLKMVAIPDHIVIHHAVSCPCCQKAFSRADVRHIGQKRQVFDLPEPRLIVTEHQEGHIYCCGQVHKGKLPDNVSQPVQYGTRIRTLSVLLNNDYKMPFDKIEQLFADIYGCSYNESTAINHNKIMYEALAPLEQEIIAKILVSKVAHFDETGMRVEGKLHWFHTACTPLYTYLFVHKKRGKEALNSAQSLLPLFKNWAVHDCWKSYFDFKDCSHALCNAHIIRELQALIEYGSKWAAKMQEFLLELLQKTQKATQISQDKETWIQKFQSICQDANNEEPKPIQGKRGRAKNTKGRNLLNRLVAHQDGILAFAFHQDIPFTNNQAERDIRCLKTKQKIATSFRTFEGAKQYARIQSCISTFRKLKINIFHALCNVLDKKNIVLEYA